MNTNQALVQSTLFAMPGEAPEPTAAVPSGPPRVQRPQREQVLMMPVHLDGLLPDDHMARAVWEYVQGLDLSALYQNIRSLADGPGRPAIDPRILVSLWLYATLEGVGSARQLATLCEDHLVYQWLCGGVSVNYHTLADVRVGHGAVLDRLLTDSVALLLHEGLVTLERVAQDGMRVRASAGAASFRRRPSLERCWQEASAQVQALRTELEADPASSQRRQQQRRRQVAEDRLQRVQRALEQLPRVEAQKKSQHKDVHEARVSTTDAEARVMKMPDGGFRPAYNAQFASDTATQVVTGVEVVNVGSDQGQLQPMIAQIAERYQQLPQEALADGGFATHEDITTLSTAGVRVYTPLPKPQTTARRADEARRDDPPAVAALRQRMATAAAQEIYKERAATAECVNARARYCGLRQVVVRGLVKVRCVLLWFALAHNLYRTLALRAAARKNEG